MVVVIKREKKNDKVFRTQEKAEIETQIFGLLKAHISIIGRTPLGKLFSLSADHRALSKTNAQTTYNRQKTCEVQRYTSIFKSQITYIT